MTDRFIQAVTGYGRKSSAVSSAPTGEDHSGVEGVCCPVSSLDELLVWERDPSLVWPESTVPKAPVTSYKIEGFGGSCHLSQNIFSPSPRIISHTAPKTIFCHDFKGGYLEDK